jgi:DNA-binding NarL/FixJ family response regulator
MAALEQVGSGKFDAVLTGVWLRTLSGLEIVRGLRQAGYTGPIIAITADEQEETRQKALSCGCSQVLVKPYQFTELADALARHLPAASAQSDEAPALASAYWSDQQMQSLIRTFVERLVGQVAEMQRQISRARLDMPLQKLCMEIKGAAGGYGYPQISQAAQRLLRMIKQDAGAASVHGQLMELQQLAQSAQAFIGEQSAGLPVRRDPAVKATT